MRTVVIVLGCLVSWLVLSLIAEGIRPGAGAVVAPVLLAAGLFGGGIAIGRKRRKTPEAAPAATLADPPAEATRPPAAPPEPQPKPEAAPTTTDPEPEPAAPPKPERRRLTRRSAAPGYLWGAWRVYSAADRVAGPAP